MNIYGHQGARLDSEQSIRGESNKHRTLIFWVFSPVLFFSPDTYLRSLEKIWIDKTINQIYWKEFIDHFKEDWERLILNVSCMSNALYKWRWPKVSKGYSHNDR